MSWFDERKNPGIKNDPLDRKESRMPEGLWVKCPSCEEVLHRRALEENLKVCSNCQYHFRLTATERIAQLCDEGEFVEIDHALVSIDPLSFQDSKSYSERLEQSQKKFSSGDAFCSGKAKLNNISFYLGAFEFGFMGGSMSVVVGEKITRLFEAALNEKLPVVVVSASGGARMQEGILSLMQMAKTNGLLTQLQEKGIPFISVLTDPTTGGVAASFATQGDLIFAEPKALIGFAGPRVIEQSMKQALPEGFQRSEFLLEHGLIDRVVHRKNLREEVLQGMWRLGYQTCKLQPLP